MSNHEIPIVSVQLEPHPNADSLSLVKIYGWTVVARTADWADKTKGIYIPPDFTVPLSRPEFAFLDTGKGETRCRIRVKKLRGILSQGLLVPVPPGLEHLPLGSNVIQELEIERYEPPMPVSTGGEAEPAPSGSPPCYDVESYERYCGSLVNNEKIVATEKIHGANARFMFDGERMWAGSRAEWKRPGSANIWWRCLESYPVIETFCRTNPNFVVYGEVFGSVQSFKYGAKPGEVKFAAFDILDVKNNRWLDYHEAKILAEMIPWVPEVYCGPLEDAEIRKFASGKSLIPGADHIREGICIRPLKERYDESCGRVVFKIVSPEYLEKS